MSAHPQLKKEDATAMVTYILELTEANDRKNKIPVKGAFTPPASTTDNFLFSVLYKDRGSKNIVPQTVQESFLLRNPKLRAITCDDYEDVQKYNNEVVSFTKPDSYITFKKIDLTNIGNIRIAAHSQNFGILELRAGSPTGPLLTSITISPAVPNSDSPVSQSQNAPIKSLAGKHDLFIVYKNSLKKLPNKDAKLSLAWLAFE